MWKNSLEFFALGLIRHWAGFEGHHQIRLYIYKFKLGLFSCRRNSSLFMSYLINFFPPYIVKPWLNFLPFHKFRILYYEWTIYLNNKLQIIIWYHHMNYLDIYTIQSQVYINIFLDNYKYKNVRTSFDSNPKQDWTQAQKARIINL